MAENEVELKSLLMKVKEEQEKSGLVRTQLSKSKILTSGPITSWQIDGETKETVTDFIFLDSKITANGDWSHEIKRCLLLGRKAMTNLKVKVKSLSHVWLFATPWTQHNRPPCPSPTPGVHPNPCPLCWWCHPSPLLSSPSPPAFNLSQHQGLF